MDTKADIKLHYRQRLNLAYQPSSYQAGVFSWIENGRGHAVVEAVAGSGKTTTIVSAAKLISGQGLFVAFNKSIATLLGEKLEGTQMQAKTVHSHGFGTIRFALRGQRVKVDTRKYMDMIDRIADQAFQGDVDGIKLSCDAMDEILRDGFPKSQASRLLDLARLNLLSTSSRDFAAQLDELAYHHAIDISDELLDVVVMCVRRCMESGRLTPNLVDYTDMVWLPVANDYRPYQFSWIFVDECQDISKAHLLLIRKSLRRGGRMLMVGDRRQCIYGFAGAGSESFQSIIDTMNAEVLPLSICYRCPKSVVNEARKFCPQIEASESAPDGSVREMQNGREADEVREGDMVLCRVNAPLVSMCFSLIAQGVPAAVRGRNIGEGLARVVNVISKRIARSGADFRNSFSPALSDWSDAERAKAQRRYKDQDRADERCQAIEDQAECIRVVFARTEAKSGDDLVSAIDDLFSDDRTSVILSSIHKAKGLEAPRVFILEPERLERPRASRGWMLEQERNLFYVALTRAMSDVVFIRDDANDAPSR